MSKTLYWISGALSNVVAGTPIGTNLGLVYLLWTIMSGRLLPARGAIHPALAATGLCEAEVRRAWRALWSGQWETHNLLENWQAVVEAEGHWQANSHDGYRPVAVDLTAFFRPRLVDLETQHYQSQSGKAQPAIPFGLAARVGSIDSVRYSVPLVIERMPEDETSEATLKAELLSSVQAEVDDTEVLVLDAGFSLSHLREADVERFVLRMAKNCTACRNELPPYKGNGRPPEYGEIVRPLARVREGNRIEATPPDCEETIVDGEHIIRVQLWDNLVGRSEKVGTAEPFTCAVIRDPRFHDPLVLIASVPLSAEAMRNMYRDRWSVEMIPQTAKQMLGAHRQFVHAPSSRQRLPELALLAGSMLSYLAATHAEASPTGYWDRRPSRTPGRLRRALARLSFSELPPLAEEIRGKSSCTDHLPKGVEAHRRQPAAFYDAEPETIAA